MKYFFIILMLCAGMNINSWLPNEKIEAKEKPNFVIILSDDVSPEQMSILYGANCTKTPNFNSIAQNGVLFNNAFASTSSCAPARASLLTCRNIWQNQEAGVHLSIYPKHLKDYVTLLQKNGYHCGSKSKVWKPGYTQRNNLGGKVYGEMMDDAFYNFLDDNELNKPFHFFITTNYGHSPFKDNKYELYESCIDTLNVPPYLPNNFHSKKKLLNANFEIEKFDKKIGRVIEILKERNLYDNTVIIVSSDNGTTLGGHSKGKGVYKHGCGVPLAIQWPNGMKDKGREIPRLTTQMDVSKTILSLAEIRPGSTMTEGESLESIFYNDEQLESRDHIFLGFERHAVTRPMSESCYPVRSILTPDYQYIWNLEADRHIWGPNNVHGFSKDDGSMKTSVSKHKDQLTDKYFNAYTKKRPEHELFDLNEDPGCLENLAYSVKYSTIRDSLQEILLAKLKKDNDPRILNNGQWFDMAPFPPNKMDKATTEGCYPYSLSYNSPFERN